MNGIFAKKKYSDMKYKKKIYLTLIPQLSA